MKKIKIIALIIFCLFIAFKIFNALLMTDYYNFKDQGDLEIDFNVESNWGVGQGSGYYIDLKLTNRKTDKSKTHQLRNDRCHYEFYVGKIDFQGKSIKTILVKDVRYSQLNIYDYQSLDQLDVLTTEYTGGWVVKAGSSDTSFYKTQENLISQYDTKPFAIIENRELITD